MALDNQKMPFLYCNEKLAMNGIVFILDRFCFLDLYNFKPTIGLTFSNTSKKKNIGQQDNFFFNKKKLKYKVFSIKNLRPLKKKRLINFNSHLDQNIASILLYIIF